MEKVERTERMGRNKLRVIRLAETCRKASARGVLKAMSPMAMGPPTPWWARSLPGKVMGEEERWRGDLRSHTCYTQAHALHWDWS